MPGLILVAKDPNSGSLGYSLKAFTYCAILQPLICLYKKLTDWEEYRITNKTPRACWTIVQTKQLAPISDFPYLGQETHTFSKLLSLQETHTFPDWKVYCCLV